MSAIRDYSLVAKFHADWETAERLRDALQLTANALVAPTKENTSALLELAVSAMSAEVRRERGGSAA